MESVDSSEPRALRLTLQGLRLGAQPWHQAGQRRASLDSQPHPPPLLWELIHHEPENSSCLWNRGYVGETSWKIIQKHTVVFVSLGADRIFIIHLNNVGNRLRVSYVPGHGNSVVNKPGFTTSQSGNDDSVS